MNNILFPIVNLSHKFNRQHVQFFFSLLALALFVLGAGAPDDGNLLPR
jgi:hypothetical protein